MCKVWNQLLYMDENLLRYILTLIVPKYSATLFMQGGGVIYDPPPLISGHSGHKGTN